MDKLEEQPQRAQSEPKAQPGDWKKQCSPDYHTLEFIKTNKARIVEDFAWLKRPHKAYGTKGCMPLREHSSWTPNLTLATQKTYTHWCGHCKANHRIALSSRRCLGIINTADDSELWKWVERLPDGTREYQASHRCKLEGSEECWCIEHILCEPRAINLGPRMSHQGGGYCDCEDYGRPKCLGENQKYVSDISLMHSYSGRQYKPPAPAPAPATPMRYETQSSVSIYATPATVQEASSVITCRVPGYNVEIPAALAVNFEKLTPSARASRVTRAGFPACISCSMGKKGTNSTNCDRGKPCNQCTLDNKPCMYPNTIS